MGTEDNYVLKLGDIIQIQSPTNLELHEQTFFIEFIDNNKIVIINIADNKKEQLNLREDGSITDESIISIDLLNRSEEEGYARQNGLLPYIWLDIHIGGDVPAIITGQITNLEEDMIEITTFPELDVIFIDFEYKGLPETIPIDKFVIRSKPVTAAAIQSLSEIRIDDEDTTIDIPMDEKATMEYTETGESIIRIPDKAVVDDNIRDVLHSMYLDANDIIFGEELEDIEQLVEIPESQRRYSIEIQVNDMMDELLSTIPNSKRTKQVMDNIHNLIERFKQLRNIFSTVDENTNVTGFVQRGHLYKPMIERIQKLDTKLQWLVPVVSQKRILNTNNDDLYKDVIPIQLSNELNNQVRLLEQYRLDKAPTGVNKYFNLYSNMNKYMTPIEAENTDDSLVNKFNVLSNFDSIVNNLGDFLSTVYKKSKIDQRKYVIQRYNLGLMKKDSQLLRSGKTVYIRNHLTPNDNITIKSFMMLPEPVMRFSQIELPGTNIATRVSHHQNYFSLFRLFHKKTDITSHVVDNLEKEIDYEKLENENNNEFLSTIKDYSLDESLMNESDKFAKFLKVIVPKTRTIFRLIRKYIKDKFSLVEIIKELEPFMIYPDDITYQQYNEIRFYIKEKIKEYKTNFLQNSKEFESIRNLNLNTGDAKINKIENILFEKNELLSLFKEGYKLGDGKHTSSELLHKLTNMDNITLFSDIVALLTIKTLTNPTDLLNSFEPANIDDMSNLEKIKPMDCVRRYLTKKYASIKDLQSDNGNDEVYYDKDYDDTQYSIMDKYKSEQKKMEPTVFLEFLTESLIHKHDAPPNYAGELAVNLIAGKKRVNDGEYAVLILRPKLPSTIDETTLSPSEKKSIEIESESREKIQYFRRIKNHWVLDNDINDESFIDTNTLFCNIRSDCFKNQSNKICESNDSTKKRLDELTKSRMVKEFENRVSISIEQLDERIKKVIGEDFKKIHSMMLLRDIKRNMYNNYAYELGRFVKNEELLSSPHIPLRELILGQDDFVKKQSDIVKFVGMYCREPMIDELKEEPFWFYCKNTNTKLLPESLFLLASAFVSGKDYNEVLNQVCRKYGILSDDGDSIVDKYSGYTLRKIDFVTEDGYTEEGFRIITHDVIEKDLGEKLTEMFIDTKMMLFENKLNETIYNITRTICSNIGIPTDSIIDFVIRNTNDIMDSSIQDPIKYEENAIKMEKKNNIRPIPYEIYKNRFMFWIIASNILIAIQTAIPSFHVKKTYPGCVRSFSGYPLEGGIEDITGIEYIACAIFKLKSSVVPWNSIERLKIEDYVKKIKETIDKFIINVRPDILDLYTKKREYILLHPNEVIPEEHGVDKWRTFLPPVVQFTVGSLRNIPSDFEKELFDLIRKGHKDQRGHLSVIKGKCILHSYGIIELINKIVKTKDLLLKTSGKVPFIENACCNESGISSPIQYFINEDSTIQNYVNIVTKLYELLKEIGEQSKANILYHPDFTGTVYPVLSNSIMEEDIYAAFIYYCNFDSELPVPDHLTTICSEKPAGYKSSWSLLEKVEFLKKNGKRYGPENLHQLMYIVNDLNKIQIRNKEYYTQVDVIFDLLDRFDSSDSIVIERKFRDHLRALLSSYNPNQMKHEATSELNTMKNYLSKANERMFYDIVKFFDTYGNLSDSEYEKTQDLLMNIMDTKMNESDALYRITNFLRNFVYSTSRLFPEMILNNNIFYYIPEHNGLSLVHMGDINKFVKQYWSGMIEFHGDVVIYELLREVKNRLTDLFLLVKEIPVYSSIQKDGVSFYSLFDDEAIQMLYMYFWYSVIYEYIACSNNSDLLRADIEEKKRNVRKNILEMGDVSNQAKSIDDSTVDDDFQEIEIKVGNTEELKARVAKLLLLYLKMESDNKKSSLLSYAEISKKIRKSKDDEKHKVITYLGELDIEQRKIEEQFKKYKMGKWNVGLQKGLVQYDPKTYDRERIEMDNLEEFDFGITNENEDENEDKNEDEDDAADNEGYDISQFGDDYQDGVYHEDDREENEFGDE
jgi:hypothetical protein